MQTMSPECRCDGSGTYTVTVPLADAVASVEQQCPVHGQQPAAARALALDTNLGRLGEVMAEPDDQSAWYWLRPVGGGQEWDALPEDVELINVARLLDDTAGAPA